MMSTKTTENTQINDALPRIPLMNDSTSWLNHNAGPRNIFQYEQARQALGMYRDADFGVSEPIQQDNNANRDVLPRIPLMNDSTSLPKSPESSRLSGETGFSIGRVFNLPNHNAGTDVSPRSVFQITMARSALGLYRDDQHLTLVGSLPTEPTIDPESSTPRDDADVWQLCQEITNKKNWYSKVFDDNIVAHWRAEIPPESADNFALALKLLRASAQGCKHLEDCNWDEGSRMCRDCKYNLKQNILNNPQEYNLNPEDIDLDFFKHEGWDFDYDDHVECKHPRCTCTAPDSSLNSYIEYHPQLIAETIRELIIKRISAHLSSTQPRGLDFDGDEDPNIIKLVTDLREIESKDHGGIISHNLHAECKQVLAELADKEPVDWHPGSDNKVRDIIHPSMYCYVKGVSKHYDDTVAPECDESVRFQWLPSEFQINPDGTVKVSSYINNLDENKHPQMIPLIQKIFGAFLPSLEHVLKRNLRNLPSLQVIVKVGSIILTPENPKYPGGSWHIEGLPIEHIIATCIHYVDTDNITDSFLEFRKPTIINEENVDYPQGDSAYTEHHYGILDHHDGVMNRYLGLIRCHEGASVVFPNTLQHRVKDFSLADPSKPSLRTILAFFVIDPDHTIVSTEDVPPQQEIFTVEQAHHYRELLMFHRKYFVSRLNETVFERPFSLCEH